MQPAVGRATMPLQDGVTFGAKNASGAVHAAKTRYAQSLSATMTNLTEFINAAKIMADGGREVAQDFERSTCGPPRDRPASTASADRDGSARAARAAPNAGRCRRPRRRPLPT
jgi:hypothetical protein